jgi:AAA ATPase domain
LRVRIGLGTGESTVKDGDYFGMPAAEAARLCDEAPADGILVSPATRLLAGRVDGVRFESVGELELKGIAGPMEAFAVVWEPLADESGIGVGAWPVPAALRSVPRVAYVGRVAERGLLERARAQARGGARQAVLVSGEPGIGKTRLASYAALGANAEGFAVCWGACSEDLAAPYEPWIEVCSQLVEHAPGDVLGGYVAARGGEIARLARNLARRVPDAPAPQSTDPETERFLLFKAVGELLRVVAGSQPMCVVLDDFHWADGQSVALLKHVTGAVEHAALMVIVIYRDSDLTKDHPLTGVLADLRRSEGVVRIGLSGLGPDEVAELVAAAAGHALDADGLALAGGLATETGGNPFFVGEILRNLIESGAITFDETARRWSVDRAAMSRLPESVREVVEHRIDRLGEQAREALRIAAATFACEFHHRHGLRVWEVRSELGWADALAERGERDRAREHASRALELSRDHGYGAFEPRAAVIVTSHTAIEP